MVQIDIASAVKNLEQQIKSIQIKKESEENIGLQQAEQFSQSSIGKKILKEREVSFWEYFAPINKADPLYQHDCKKSKKPCNEFLASTGKIIFRKDVESKYIEKTAEFKCNNCDYILLLTLYRLYSENDKIIRVYNKKAV